MWLSFDDWLNEVDDGKNYATIAEAIANDQ